MRGDYERSCSWPEGVKTCPTRRDAFRRLHGHDESYSVVDDERVFKRGLFGSRPWVQNPDPDLDHPYEHAQLQVKYGSGDAPRQRMRENLESCGYVEDEEEFRCAACGSGTAASRKDFLGMENRSRVRFSESRKALNERLLKSYFLGPHNFCSEYFQKVDFNAHDDLTEGVTAGLHALTTRSGVGEFQCQCDYCSKGGMEVHVRKQEFFSRNGSVDHLKASTRRHKQCCRRETDFQADLALEEEEEEEEEEKEEDDDVCCYLCIEPFDSLLDKRWHEYDQHLTCSACFKNFASRRAFDTHISESKGHNFCFECNRNFPFREQLAQHRRCTTHKTPYNSLPTMSDVGVKKKVYVCNKCHDYEGDDIFMKFATEQELQNHIDTMHNTCLKCDKDFPSRQALSEHILQSYRHHFCRECDYDFPSKQAFDMHCRTGLHMD